MTRFPGFILLPLAVACAPVEAPPPPLAESAAAPAAESFASERIAVEVRGEGPDVVLVPGLSSAPQVWESTVAAMPGYRYHLVRVRGFGADDPGANASGEVLMPVASEIARYIEEAGLERPAMVGHSLGGSLGIIVAARHPHLVGRLMVVDMLPFMGPMFAGPGATPESVEPIAAQIRDGIANAEEERRRQSTERTIAGMVRTEELRPQAVATALASDPELSGRMMYELITTDLRPALARIEAPLKVLYVRGPEAPVTDEQMRAFYEMSYANAPQAEIVQIPGAYHFIMWDEPETFRRELREFLAE
ncbi:MAG: alpha/beta fold hydrolase [Sphingomonadaceae bacterium]